MSLSADDDREAPPPFVFELPKASDADLMRLAALLASHAPCDG